ncbi:hypothetical protein JW766_02765 [Candidatus Dojkabacteria bacterium]|nr:hypothetical protein [Candidatus Dojkabacteria bacterium]
MISKQEAKNFLRAVNIRSRKVILSLPNQLKQNITTYAESYSKVLDITHNKNHLYLAHNTSFSLLGKILNRRKILKEEQNKLKVLIFASSLLHDCASRKYPSYRKKDEHSYQCSVLAYKKLDNWGAERYFAQAVKKIISCHDSTGYKLGFKRITKIGPYSRKIIRLGAKILYDADKLQTIGIYGVIRGLLNGTISQDSSLNDLKSRNQKQLKKLKLKESLELCEEFGLIKKTKDLTETLKNLKRKIEQI